MKINKKLKTKIILTFVAALGLLFTLYLVVAWIKHYPPFSTSVTISSLDGQMTNLERSDTEKAVTSALQEDPEQKLQNDQTDVPQTPSTTPSGKSVANVILTNAGIYNGTVSAGGMITNIVEDGGQCTYTFTNGGLIITKSSTTLINPTSTSCKTVTFSASELSQGGTWQVQLSYSSAAAEGVSNVKEIAK